MDMAETSLSPEQREHVRALIERYTARTAGSRALARGHRSHLADPRAVIGFRPELRELRYPIVAQHSEGAHIRDVDGNDYVDISMGLGTHLFGHGADFLMRALRAQLVQGIHLGARTPQVGDVARRICRMTGTERAVFCTSGTHAVATAIRLVRARAARSRIALFRNSYHGHASETLAYAPPSSHGERAMPMGPGIPQSAADEVLVLEYGDERSLDLIEAHAGELAAVLVEPVQTRRLDLRPIEFLRQLREVTRRYDIALVFDEVVTGFRVHPRGAQGYFGIQADLAVYGKLLGGGLPIGVVAGSAAHLDAIDGGPWRHGDSEAPAVEPIVFGGTFNCHPLSMAAAQAVLMRLEEAGPALQEHLDRTTARLVAELGDYFDRHGLPIRIDAFGSMFRFMPMEGSALFLPIDIELLHYHLVNDGFYLWEGRLAFISTAHTDEDVDALIHAVQRAATELRRAGFLEPMVDASEARRPGQ